MRVLDLVPAAQEEWLKWVVRNFSGVARLYLIYDDRKFGPDTARDIANGVLPEDFVPEEDGFEILSNEQLRVEKQQGITRPFGQTLGTEDHQWWIELYLDRDLWDLLPEGRLNFEEKNRDEIILNKITGATGTRTRGMTADIPPPRKTKKRG